MPFCCSPGTAGTVENRSGRGLRLCAAPGCPAVPAPPLGARSGTGQVFSRVTAHTRRQCQGMSPARGQHSPARRSRERSGDRSVRGHTATGTLQLPAFAGQLVHTRDCQGAQKGFFPVVFSWRKAAAGDPQRCRCCPGCAAPQPRFRAPGPAGLRLGPVSGTPPGQRWAGFGHTCSPREAQPGRARCPLVPSGSLWFPLVPGPCRGGAGDTETQRCCHCPRALEKCFKQNHLKRPTVKVLQKHVRWTLHLGRIKLLKNFFR